MLLCLLLTHNATHTVIINVSVLAQTAADVLLLTLTYSLSNAPSRRCSSRNSTSAASILLYLAGYFLEPGAILGLVMEASMAY